MESIVKKSEVVETKPSRLVLDNRKLLEISGVSKVVSVNANNAEVVVSGTKLYIEGADISIEKLDVESGVLKLGGIFNEFRYTGKSHKMPFFKRLSKSSVGISFVASITTSAIAI